MGLRTERVGEAFDLHVGGEPRQLGGVAEGGDVADLAVPDADRAAAGDQHPLSG